MMVLEVVLPIVGLVGLGLLIWPSRAGRIVQANDAANQKERELASPRAVNK